MERTCDDAASSAAQEARDPLLAYPVLQKREPWWHKSLFDPLIRRQLKDERDLGPARMMLRLGIFLPLCAAALYVDAWRNVWTAGLYLAFIFWWMATYILGMHVHYHRPWFKSRALNKFMPAYVGTFFGMTVSTYFAHHLAMHHPEDNEEGDLSSTRGFKRDSAAHLAYYVIRFVLIGIPELALYHYRKGKHRVLRELIVGELFSWSVIFALALVDWEATLIVLVIPLFTARVGMMVGNWGQHAFVRPEGETINTLGSTLLDTAHNRRCFNNGYHALHHHRQAMHWAELPDEYLRRRPGYEADGSVVFRGVPTFQAISFALIFRQYAYLERHLVTFDGDERTPEERIEMLRRLTLPVPA